MLRAASIGAALISCWQAEEGAVPPPQQHPGSKEGLKSNDASCQLRQAARVNELAPALDWAAAEAPGNVAHFPEGRGPAGASRGLLETQDGTDRPASL